MAVSLTLQQNRTIAGDNTYTVQSTVTSATGMSSAVFVYSASTLKYSHVATVHDLVSFPSSVNPSVAFYRSASVTLTYKDANEAVAAADNVKMAVNELVQTYGASATAYPGTSVSTYTYPPAT